MARFLVRLEQYSDSHCTGYFKAYIDNQATIDIINSKNSPHFNCKFYPMARYLWNITKEIRTHGEWNWIKAHTVNDSIPAQINSQADILAKTIRSKQPQHSRWPHCFQEWGMIYHKQVPILQVNHIIELIGTEICREHLKGKWKWSDEMINTIDWNTYANTMSQVTANKRLFWSRGAAGWLPTNQKRNPIDGCSPKCPTCCNQIETQEHMFQCVTESTPECNAFLYDECNKIHTDPCLTRTLHRILQPWYNNEIEEKRKIQQNIRTSEIIRNK